MDPHTVAPIDKVWGRTRPIYLSDTCSVHALEAVRSGYCSRHRHATRGNRFYVISGLIRVRLYDHERNQTASVLLGPYELYDVPAKIWHRFEVLETASLIEIYWPDGGKVRENDIERWDVGGLSVAVLGTDENELAA